MNPGFHFGCGMSAAASLSDRGASQSPQARPWPDPDRFSPSERRRFLELRQPGSGRSGISVARMRDLRAVRATVPEPLRYDLSLRGHGREDGRVLHAQGRPDARLPLLSRVTFLQRRALLQANATVALHLGIRMKPEDLKTPTHESSRLHRERICAQGRVFSQTSRCCGLQQNLNPIPVLLTAQGGMRRLKERSYSMRRTIRCRPGRNAATAESHIQRMREAQ